MYYLYLSDISHYTRMRVPVTQKSTIAADDEVSKFVYGEILNV